MDLRVPRGLDLKTCRLADDGVLGLQVWYADPADKYFVLLPDSTASVYLLEVAGQRQVLLAQYSDAATEADLAELQDVLNSIRFE